MIDNGYSFFVSVIANIIAYYICKWLDRYYSSNSILKKQRSPPLLFLVSRFDRNAAIRLQLEYIIVTLN